MILLLTVTYGVNPDDVFVCVGYDCGFRHDFSGIRWYNGEITNKIIGICLPNMMITNI